MAYSLQQNGLKVLTGGTDNHLLLLDLRDTGITGQELQDRLEDVGITANKNAIPFDKENKTITSGLRLGTAAVTSRGLGYEEMMIIANVISSCTKEKEIYEDLKDILKMQIHEICDRFPLYD